MKEEYPNYLKFVDEALELAKDIPKYFSKYSNKIYCNHQKLAIVVLMQRLKMTSREIIAFLKVSSEIRLLLGLHKIPVHTTILRFMHKIKKLSHLILAIDKVKKAAIDSTGFALESKSYYYRTIWNQQKKQKTKRFMKLSITVDTNNQFILRHKIRRKLRNDNVDFKVLLKKLKVNYVIADKGYDSRENRKYVYQNNAIPQIPFKKNSGRNGYYQKKAVKDFNKEIYGQRAKVETVFSVIKRKYGSMLRARSYKTQEAELISKLIAYNVDRKTHYIYLFYERVAPEL